MDGIRTTSFGVVPGALAAYLPQRSVQAFDTAFELIVCGHDSSTSSTRALRLLFDGSTTVERCHYGAGLHVVCSP